MRIEVGSGTRIESEIGIVMRIELEVGLGIAF